jgi:hypothetical protein
MSLAWVYLAYVYFGSLGDATKEAFWRKSVYFF